MVKVEFSDIIFFRFGFYGYIKLNTQSMVLKYTRDAWYTVNMLIDYETQVVSIYLQGPDDDKPKPVASQAFFTERTNKLEGVNALSLYNLSPGSQCQIRNLKVCEDEVCEGTGK